MKGFIVAWQLLTGVPILPRLRVDAKDIARSVCWYPIVGLGVGLVLWAIYRVTGPWLGRPLEAVVLLAAEALLTRGMHLDGLADTADGLGVHGDAARRLRAMADSRIGALGAVALGLVLLTKYAALTSIPDDRMSLALLGAPILGRWAIVWVGWWAPPARSEGMGRIFAGSVGARDLAIATIVAWGAVGLIGTVWGGRWWTAAVAAACVTALGSGLVWRRSFGGATGDTLGATSELTETLVWVVLAVHPAGS